MTFPRAAYSQPLGGHVARGQQMPAPSATVWRYLPANGRPMDIRTVPKIEGPRTEHTLQHGEFFKVSQQIHGEDGVVFLRLEDGRGWAFDKLPGVGSMCVTVGAPAAASSVSPPPLRHWSPAPIRSAMVQPRPLSHPPLPRPRIQQRSCSPTPAGPAVASPSSWSSHTSLSPKRQPSTRLQAWQAPLQAKCGASVAHRQPERSPSGGVQQTNIPVPAQPTSVATLCKGAIASICGSTFRITDLLGQGSFGFVWAADRCEREKANIDACAIKEIVCRSRQALSVAEAESRILRGAALVIAGDKVTSSALARDVRIPLHLGSETQQIGAEMWRVLLVMSRIPGESLDKFLDSRRAVAACVGARHSHPEFYGLASAARLAHAMIYQLSGAFERLSAYVYHRDANLGNILIGHSHSSPPTFSLVDFGLAVEVASWKAGGWQHENISGDCRYWPASSWLMFGAGVAALFEHSTLQEEYVTQLDFHSLGLTALQVIIELSCSVSGTQDSDKLVRRRCQELGAAWQKYWADASQCSREVIRAFRGETNVHELQSLVSKQCVHMLVQRNLQALRRSAMDLRSALLEQGSGEEALVAAVLEVILSMIASGDGPTIKPTWRRIRESLPSASGATFNQHYMSHSTPLERDAGLPHFGRLAPKEYLHKWEKVAVPGLPDFGTTESAGGLRECKMPLACPAPENPEHGLNQSHVSFAPLIADNHEDAMDKGTDSKAPLALASDCHVPFASPGGEEKEALDRINLKLGTIPRICILGGVVVQSEDSEDLIREIAQRLPSKLGSRTAYLTGGMPGVQKSFATHCDDASSLWHLVPLGSSSGFDIGQDLHAGSNLSQRNSIIGKLGDVYIVIEGGPTTSEDACVAFGTGAFVVPVARTGGAASGKFGFPREALRKPDWASESHWSLLWSAEAPVVDTADAVLRLVTSYVYSRKGKHGDPTAAPAA